MRRVPAVVVSVLAGAVVGGIATAAAVLAFRWAMGQAPEWSWPPGVAGPSVVLGMLVLVYPAALLGAWSGERVRGSMGYPVPRVDRRTLPAWRKLLFGVLGLAAGVSVAWGGLALLALSMGRGTTPLDAVTRNDRVILLLPTLAVMATRAVERCAAPRGTRPPDPGPAA